MKNSKFQEYKVLREAAENKDKSGDSQPLGAKISLGDGNDFEPFQVSDDPKNEHYGKNKNLAPIVRAFKGGGNWGWSRDDGSGQDKPVKIGSKKLYLTGGAVRDHLSGKKSKNIQLGTNASPDEVYHLMKQNGFEFVKDDGTPKSGSKNAHPNRKEGSKQFFWVEKSNKNGRPFVFGVRVNEDQFSLEVFSKTPRGVDKEMEPGTQGEDAASRDFTINSMYILLSNDNGPNKELNDFHGGIHHLQSGRIASVGDMGKKMKEDPKRLLRYVRFMHSHGDSKKIPSEERDIIGKSAEGLGKLDRKTIMGEFRKGMDKDDSDSRGYLKLFRDLGLIDKLFPGKALDNDLPKELSELGDKDMPIAWMLRNNQPEELENIGFDDNEKKKITFLIKSLGMNENLDGDRLTDLTNGYMSSGISGRKLREFATKLGRLDPSIVDAFLSYAKSPRVKLRITGDDGTEKISDEFQDLIDPFTGQEDSHGIAERKKSLELNNFKKCMEYMRPV
jgi:tRNA nucleotidyltransferase/poly(A) polymerase